MKAAVVREFGAPLAIEERPVPTPAPADVVVRVEVCGVCHTDIYAAEGSWPVRPVLPLVPGHEIVGRISALGADVTHVHLGERVAVPRLGWACGRCEPCLSGSETLCRRRRITGYDIDGGFAQYVKAAADFVVQVPHGVEPEDAACLTCAGVNAYKAVKVSGAGPSALTAVFGVGGVGHLAVQYAAIAGATVAAVDVLNDKLDMAGDLGASHLIDAAGGDPVAEIQHLGGADQAIVTAVSLEAAEQALASLKPGGVLVLVAVPLETTLPLPIFDTVNNGITVIGSSGGNRVDLAHAFALHARGHTRVVHQARALEQINEALADLGANKVPARLVLELR
jgi:alcohol dehydrogenase, propanol-preferring